MQLRASRSLRRSAPLRPHHPPLPHVRPSTTVGRHRSRRRRSAGQARGGRRPPRHGLPPRDLHPLVIVGPAADPLSLRRPGRSPHPTPSHHRAIGAASGLRSPGRANPAVNKDSPGRLGRQAQPLARGMSGRQGGTPADREAFSPRRQAQPPAKRQAQQLEGHVSPPAHGKSVDPFREARPAARWHSLPLGAHLAERDAVAGKHVHPRRPDDVARAPGMHARSPTPAALTMAHGGATEMADARRVHGGKDGPAVPEDIPALTTQPSADRVPVGRGGWPAPDSHQLPRRKGAV
jgi:hypothetical protein